MATLKCAVCKIKPASAQHHFIPGANRHSDSYKGVKQRLIPVCFSCHHDIHNMRSQEFYYTHKDKRSNFIFTDDKLTLYKKSPKQAINTNSTKNLPIKTTYKKKKRASLNADLTSISTQFMPLNDIFSPFL